MDTTQTIKNIEQVNPSYELINIVKDEVGEKFYVLGKLRGELCSHMALPDGSLHWGSYREEAKGKFAERVGFIQGN